jgi:flagellin
MGLRINTNTDALDAYRNLSMTQSKMSDSLQKLSSGYRINKAADDAAGLSISQGLQSQIGGLSQAVKNAQDGINVVQTADGALTEVDSILQRMNVLTVQANNSGSQDSGAVAAAQAEFDQLAGEIDNISKTTKFGQSNLLDGTFGGTSATVATAITGVAADTGLTGFTGTDFSNAQLDFNGLVIDGTTLAASTLTAKLTGHSTNDYGTAEAAGHYSRATDLQKDLQKSVDAALKTAVTGYTAGDVQVNVNDEGNGVWKVALSSSVAGTTLSAKGATAGDFGFTTTAATATASAKGGVFQIGADNGDTQLVKISKADSATLGVAAGTDVSAASTITAVQGAIAKVSTLRSTLGAYQNGFQHTINNLNVTVENLQSSNSAIQDTDMASEMVNFTKAQVLQQAGVSMLAQANSASQAVLKLLG